MEEIPSIKKNFVYKSALTLSTYLMAFITFPYVSRVLGVDRIGLVNFVDNTTGYFLLFATMGINILGVREISATKNNREKRSQIFSNIFGLNFSFTIIILCFYYWAIYSIPRLHQNSELFYIGSAKIIFTVFLIEWFFSGLENFRYITIRSLLIKFLYIISVFVFIKAEEDYKLYFILTISTIIINAVINLTYIQNFIDFNIRDCFRWQRYIKQNFILGFYTIMTSMYITFNVMYLGIVSDNTEVGYYTTAFKLYTVVIGLFTAFSNVMLPRISTLLANGEREKVHSLIIKSFNITSSLTIPLITICVILAPQIIYILSGPNYEGAIVPMRIIMPAVFFVGIAQIFVGQILIPMKNDKALLLTSIVGATLSIILNLIFTNKMFCIGSAIVLLLSEITTTSIYIYYVRREIKIPYFKVVKSIINTIPIAIGCYIVSIVLNNPFLILLLCLLWSIICLLPIIAQLKRDLL